MEKTSVLFVCLGNICRSPLAEGVFTHLVHQNGLLDHFEIDSAGTSAYHVGEQADARMRETAAKHGIRLTSRARQFKAKDFEEFDYIIAMDNSNHANILKVGTPSDGQLNLMRAYDPQPGDGEVPDPYFGGIDGFGEVFDIVHRSSIQLLDQIKAEKGL